MDESNVKQKDFNDGIRDFEQCGCQVGCGSCKIGRYAFPILNRFNNTKVVMVFLCFAVFLQGAMVTGITGVVISTLERRFHLRSFEAGFIAICYEIGVCISIPVVTYIGGRGYKPLWIAWGIFIMGIGGVVLSLPHFLAPAYSVPNLDISICQDSTTCDASGLRSYIGVFIAGELLLGIGSSPIYTLVLNYIDDNVKLVYSSTYHGLFFTWALLGPATGFLLGGYFLKNYVNMGESVSINTLSPLWVGNWWMGYLIMGVLSILVSVPIQFYPKQIPFTDKVRLNREKEIQSQKDAMEILGDENFGINIRDAPRSLSIILKNPTLVLISISGALDAGVLSALGDFGPKYIESVFGLSASEAALYFGVAVVLAGCSGNIFSGILVTKFKMNVPKMIKFSILAQICAFLSFFVFFAGCSTPDVTGVNVPFNGLTEIVCNSTCSGCSTALFNPVCGSDNLTYLSSCDAGCVQDADARLINCSRVLEHPNITALQDAVASKAKCAFADCQSVVFFLTFGGLSAFFTYLQSQPGIQISLRSVISNQRPLSLGVQWLITRLLGLIPFPIILGKILDLSCIVWKEECGECGACQMYDNPAIARHMAALFTTAKAISIVCLVAVLMAYKPIEADAGDKLER